MHEAPDQCRSDGRSEKYSVTDDVPHPLFVSDVVGREQVFQDKRTRDGGESEPEFHLLRYGVDVIEPLRTALASLEWSMRQLLWHRG